MDVESHLLKAGLLAPRLVCLSFAHRVGEPGGLLDREDGVARVRNWLCDERIVLVGHNIFFDLGVCAAEDPELLPLIFEKFEDGLVEDTQIRQQLIDIAQGDLKYRYDEDTGDFLKSSYHLADLSDRLLGRKLAKEDTWRLKYALLDGVPVKEWPDDARGYAITDATTTLEVREAQHRVVGDDGVIPNSVEQHQAAWALHLMSAWGVRTDAVAVAALKKSLEAEHAEAMAKLETTPLIKTNRKKDGSFKQSKYMKAIRERVVGAYKERGWEIPLTEKGAVCTERDVLVKTGDPDLILLAEDGKTAKLLSTYVPILEAGTSCPICARFNILVESGRCSCARPNLQNPPRKGGVRECFVPRDGYLYCFVDYDTLELRALSQVCLDMLGYSSMAEALRRGEDLHVSLAAEILGISPEECLRRYKAGDPEAKDTRQLAKIANFGLPGGMAADTFVEYCAGYGRVISKDLAAEIKTTWLRRWPEMPDYFARVSREIGPTGEGTVIQMRSNRVRGRVPFCAFANSLFQGLAADGAKRALWKVSKECYTDRASALWNTRPVIFVHDEIISEIPFDPRDPKPTSAAADRKTAVMIEAMQHYIPDVPITAKPVLCRRWYKGAEPVRVGGVLMPSRPQKSPDGKEIWVLDMPPANDNAVELRAAA
jgi:DNA polymerase-1